ncbi:hypothetical protein [Streptomyces sp. RTd22]|uniref:hypothetical protein n=1 Tax=Streptomyces sp. RTd22 TaxID=1841249 RepID=UPI00131AEF91|nr:hypothetical protein [Streptomyces sp. RTd22]
MRHGRRLGRGTAIVGVVVALLAATGCSGLLGGKERNGGLAYEPQRLSMERADALYRASADKIEEVAGIRHDTDAPQPWRMECEGVDHGYRIHNLWFLTGPPKGELREAMDRLHRVLPKRGWKAYRYARAHSKARQLQLDVEEMTRHHTAVIELILPSTYRHPSKWEKNDPDSIQISMDSPCYVDPEYDAPYG